MRFLSSALASLALVGGVAADLRMASQPKAGYNVRDRGQVAFVTDKAIYMEPSAFNYAGLAAQRANAYDNFLRSNIDNEQDKRNFNNEAGRDMLPFRSYEGAETDIGQATVQTKIAATAGAAGPALVATPGTPTLVPLRWNNPHASELEVNVWVANDRVVVPVKKPTCSGEGHQDNVFQFTIPNDFNAQLAAKVPGFTGCNAPGDCVLQVYAHSVEARTYSIGTPLIVTGGTGLTNTATGTAAIEAARLDVGTDLSKLPLDICLPSNSPDANIASAVPRQARLVSDVYNHAYQNSNYSPYSGQQPEAISKTLQASAVLSMTTGNRGELGKALLAKATGAQAGAAALAAKLEAKQKALIVKYEGVTNKIIAAIGNDMKTTATLVGAAPATQPEANCFRCAEVGAVTSTRLTTNTYVPSFQIPAALQAKAAALVPAQYKQLINPAGTLDIYTATLNDMQKDFAAAAAKGIAYQPAMLKPAPTTMADATQFRKRNAANANDNGLYAATLAKPAAQALLRTTGIPVTPARVTLSTDAAGPAPAGLESPFEGMFEAAEFPDNGAQSFAAPEMTDEKGIMSDSSCDNDATYVEGEPCTGALQLYTENPDGTLSTTAAFSNGDSSSDASSTSTTTLIIIGAAVGGVIVLIAIIAAAMYMKNKSGATSARTNTNTAQMTTANAV